MRGFYKKALPLLLLAFLFFMPEHSLHPQNHPGAGSWGDYLTLSVALIGPGDELYFWWGHIGLLVEDSRTERARFYDWGVFSFDQENFFVNFAFGRLIYSSAVFWADWVIDMYIRNNRSVTLYRLDLPAEIKEAIVLIAEENVLPENRDYYYHHFDDNCATRIRDILDIVLDGQFSAKFGDMPGRFTLREHIRRHLWFNPAVDWALNFWMGQNIDKPITVWEEMFLPSELAKRILEFRFTDAAGNERYLVSSVETVFSAASRPVVRNTPGNLWTPTLLVSLLFCQLLLLFYVLWERQKSFRVFLGIVNSFLGLLFGITGSMLFFLMFFTDHDYTFDNINIIFANPLFLAAIPLGLMFAFSGKPQKRFFAGRLLRILWAYVLLGCVVTIALLFFPMFFQQNQVTLALIIPIALTMVFITTRLTSRFHY